MYLHIGKDAVVKNNDIIGIFNIDYIGNTKEYKNMCAKLNEEKKLKIIDEMQKKTFVLTEKNKKINGYITNLNVSTITKRKI